MCREAAIGWLGSWPELGDGVLSASAGRPPLADASEARLVASASPHPTQIRLPHLSLGIRPNPHEPSLVPNEALAGSMSAARASERQAVVCGLRRAASGGTALARQRQRPANGRHSLSCAPPKCVAMAPPSAPTQGDSERTAAAGRAASTSSAASATSGVGRDRGCRRPPIACPRWLWLAIVMLSRLQGLSGPIEGCAVERAPSDWSELARATGAVGSGAAAGASWLANREQQQQIGPGCSP